VRRAAPGSAAPPGATFEMILLPLFLQLATLTGPGVSRELAAYRAARVADVRYDLQLDVTASGAARTQARVGADTLTGHVTVRFRRAGTGDAILDFRGPRLANPRANGRALDGVHGYTANGSHVRVPAAMLRGGENVLDFDFATLAAPAGASVIRYHDATDGATYLYTLLVPSDAHALFPCFDQPDLKARVTLALRTPVTWTAVANGALVSTRVDSAGATRLLRFAPSRPISTYLIAFAAGPWATATRTVGGRPITAYMRASRVAEVEVDSLVQANARALTWLERYFGRPYPFDKYDFVLAPAFPFGGMEHPGAVFYNEESFVFRERPTLPQRVSRTATIYHEVAHQWFGDLVTMRWFDDLWLKEGFSTYMAAKMQDALDPASEAWKTFHLRNKPPAYAVDASLGTTPVWQQLANLDQAKSNYGAIVYNKAPSVLKQLEYLVGERAFQRGVRTFLGRHAYGNATWRDLLAAVGTAAGRDLGPWGQEYILRPGIPVLETQRTPAGVRIVQRPAQAGVSRTDPWPMRTQLLVQRETEAPLLRSVTLVGASIVVPAPGATAPASLAFPNAGDHAYALTLLDEESVRWTERHLPTLRDPLLRAQLWGALWDLVREARLEPTRYVALAERGLQNERDEQIAATLLGRVTRTATRYLGAAQRDSVVPGLEEALARAAADTTRTYGIRKSHLDALIAVSASAPGLARLDALLDSTSAAGAPLRAPTRWAIVTALVARQAPTAERRLAEETRRDSTSEGRRRAFVANAARPDAVVKAEYFRRYFADRALNEEWATASLPAFSASGQELLTLPYVRPALDSLPWVQQNRRIFFLGNWLDALVGAQGSAAAVEAVDVFLRDNPRLPEDLRRKVLQSADELRRTARIRGAFAR